MQVFVNKSDLSLTGDQPINVIATYDDNVVIDPAAHGAGAIKLNVPVSAVQMTGGPGGLGRLVGNWRETAKQPIVSTEATERIDEVFPEYSQRNSVAEMNGYILTYGPDLARWPAQAQQRKAEIDRCWNYVNAVRAKAGALAGIALPADPSNNAHWPTRIAPYQPAPV